MNGTAPSSPERTALSTVPRSPPRHPGYLWTAVLVGAVLACVLAVVAWGFFTVPGTDPVRAGGWYFAISLMILVPAALVVLVLSWGVVAVLRHWGAWTWPGVVQAAPAVALVYTLLYLLLRTLLTGPD